jgi:uncharacterized membrane protein
MPDIFLPFAILGFVLVVVSVPLVLRRIPPNPIYGLRVPACYKDDQVWYDANAASGRDMIVLGVAIALLSVVLPVLGMRDFAYGIAWAVVAGAGTLVVTVLGWTRANRMLRERQAGGR